MKIEQIKITELKPYTNNAKKHPEEQIAQIVLSIQEFGFNDPIAIDENNVIIEGHGRLLAAQKLSLQEVPVIRLSHLSEEQKRAYILAHNKLTLNSGFNEETLLKELEALKDTEFEELTGFSDEEVSALFDKLTKENENTPVSEEVQTFTRKGDLWKLGDHKVYCGSSIEEEPYEILLRDKRIDLVLTDPPYNVDYSAKNTFLNSLDNGNRIEKDIKNDEIEDFGAFIGSFYKNSSKYMKPGSPIYVFYANAENQFILEFDKYLHRHEILVWDKGHAVLGRIDYHYQTEPIIYGWKEGAEHKWYGGFSTSNIISSEPTMKSKLENLKKKSKKELEKLLEEIAENAPIEDNIFYHPKPHSSTLHPTMKPVNLLKRLVRNSSIRGDVVFDGFAGSGSTLMACEELGRVSYNIELDEHYCDVIVQRYIDYKKSKNEDYTITLIRDGIETPYDQLDLQSGD